MELKLIHQNYIFKHSLSRKKTCIWTFQNHILCHQNPGDLPVPNPNNMLLMNTFFLYCLLFLATFVSTHFVWEDLSTKLIIQPHLTTTSVKEKSTFPLHECLPEATPHFFLVKNFLMIAFHFPHLLHPSSVLMQDMTKGMLQTSPNGLALVHPPYPGIAEHESCQISLAESIFGKYCCISSTSLLMFFFKIVQKS